VCVTVCIDLCQQMSLNICRYLEIFMQLLIPIARVVVVRVYLVT
jgi:hypothetical protein